MKLNCCVLVIMKFYCTKNLVFKKELDVHNIIISNKISSGEKNDNCFVGYMDDNNEIKPLCTMLTKMSAYANSYDGETKWMYVLNKGNEILRK